MPIVDIVKNIIVIVKKFFLYFIEIIVIKNNIIIKIDIIISLLMFNIYRDAPNSDKDVPLIGKNFW